MANEFYNHGSIPADNSPGSSAEIRGEFDAVQAGFNKLPTMTGNGGKVVKVNAGGTGLETKASDAEIADTVHAATAKTTPIDADEVGLADSAAAYGLKKFTFANLWTWVQAKLAAATAKATPVDADTIPLSDSAASGATKALTFANLWTWVQSKLSGAAAKTTPVGADTIHISDSAAAGATKTLSMANLVTYLSGLCSSGWSSANSGSSGSFTATGAGYYNVSMTFTVNYYVNNNVVHLVLPASYGFGSSTSTALTISGLPAGIRPSGNRYTAALSAVDNSAIVMAQGRIDTLGVINLGVGYYGGAWTSSGTKGLNTREITYSL